jgi:hypothetical protein
VVDGLEVLRITQGVARVERWRICVWATVWEGNVLAQIYETVILMRGGNVRWGQAWMWTG